MKPSELSLSKPKLKELFNRIGSEERLKKILRNFYQRMSEDIMIGFFFDGKDLKQIAETQSEFLLKAMGVRESYSGKAPARAHDQTPPILAGHFDRRLFLLKETLKSEALDDWTIETWVSFEEAFRNGIVSKEKFPGH